MSDNNKAIKIICKHYFDVFLKHRDLTKNFTKKNDLNTHLIYTLGILSEILKELGIDIDKKMNEVLNNLAKDKNV